MNFLPPASMHILLVGLLALACSGLSSAATITQLEFNTAITSLGYPQPADEVYYLFVVNTQSMSREEIAMFMAQVSHESGAFQFVEESACQGGNQCAGQYVDSVGLPDKSYHARGYIQMRYGANYKAASEALGLGDLLLRKPELVASNKSLAMRVSVWYWQSVIRPKTRGKENEFGTITRAMSQTECAAGASQAQAKHRWELYQGIAKVLNIVNMALEKGCYN